MYNNKKPVAISKDAPRETETNVKLVHTINFLALSSFSGHFLLAKGPPPANAAYTRESGSEDLYQAVPLSSAQSNSASHNDAHN